MAALCLLALVVATPGAYAQNDFLGCKYSVINDKSTMDPESYNNAEIVLAPSLVKSPSNPLFGQDKPWEPRIDNGYPNVVHIPNNGNKTFELWYDSFLQVSGGFIEGTLYAQSEDGIKWYKPDLGLVDFKGSSANNIVLTPSGGVGVFRDIYTQNASELYKALGVLPKADGLCRN